MTEIKIATTGPNTPATRQWRRSTAYPCANYGCENPATWVETREVKPHGMPASVGFYGACEHHKLEVDLKDSGMPIGLTEIAQLLNVAPSTPHQWRARKLLPEPDGHVSGAPCWWPDKILDWAEATGRSPESRVPD